LEFYIQVTKGTSLKRFVKRIVELIENKKAANDSELEVLPHQQSLSMHSSGLIKGHGERVSKTFWISQRRILSDHMLWETPQ
jgi:hypothetical protein